MSTDPPARVRVAPGGAEPIDTAYDVLIGPGLLDSVPSLLRERAPATRYAVIADSNTGPLYGDRLCRLLADAGLASDLFVFPAGEANKSRESWMNLSDRMFERRYGRDSAVLALGGGVTGDLAGFVAATYMRGVPLVQLPTSLLAMIDSSVGGKTGVDTPAGKNLIGAFHQPDLVVADTETLRTLPPAEVRAGLAEAIKHGAIADSDYFDWIADSVAPLLELDGAAMVRLVRRSVEIKAMVVGADEKERGMRKILNFGHTVGHAVEARSGYALLHGQAISIGMVVEAGVGEVIGVTRRGTADRLRQVLDAFGLPTGVPGGYPTREILDLARLDKKAREGRIEYSLVEEIGAASRGAGAYGTPVPDDVVAEVLESFAATGGRT